MRWDLWLTQRGYNPRPPHKDAQSGRDMIDMSKGKQKKKGQKWTTADDDTLLAMSGKRIKRAEIAKVLGRSISSCDQRLFNLRLAKGTNPQKMGSEMPYRGKRSVSRKVLDGKPIVAPKAKASEPTPMDDMLTSMKEIFKQNTHQKAVIQDTIEKLEVLIGRLRRALE